MVEPIGVIETEDRQQELARRYAQILAALFPKSVIKRALRISAFEKAGFTPEKVAGQLAAIRKWSPSNATKPVLGPQLRKARRAKTSSNN